MARLTPSERKKTRSRRGPKPKLIKDQKLRPEYMKPIQRPERSWSQRQKIRALVFLYHHHIPSEFETSGYQAPSQQEASDIFNIPQQTISDWVKKQDKIEQYGMSSSIRSARTTMICQWPELESELYELFLERRGKGQAIRRAWFQIYADEIFRKLYPNADSTILRFSNGWFRLFLGRFCISLRCITKKAQKVPENYRKLVVNWI